MDAWFEKRLPWHAHRSLAGKYPKGEIAASTTYAREVIDLRKRLADERNMLHWLLDEINRATVAHMTQPDTPTPPVIAWLDEVPEPVDRPFLRPFKHTEVIDALKANPGVWALIGDGFNGVHLNSTDSMRKRGIKIKVRTNTGPARDHNGRKLVSVYGAYFPPVEVDPDADNPF